MSRLDFHRKATPVLPALRPLYKIAMILVFLKLCSVGGKASLLKLHLFNWAITDSTRLKTLILSADKKEMLNGVWGVDPALNMAIGYAEAEKLIERTSNGSYKITPIGNKFMDGVQLLALFEEEVADLKSIGKRITESMVNEAAQRWINEI